MIKRYFVFFAFLCLLVASCSQKQADEERVIPTKMEDLYGKKISVTTGGIYEILLSQDPHFDKLVKVNSTAECLAAVTNGVAEYEVEDDVVLLGVDIAERGVDVAFYSDFMKGDYGVAFRKGGQKDIDLWTSFNAYLDTIKANGTFDAMRERWLKSDADASSMPDYPVITGGDPVRVGIVPAFPFTFVSHGRWVGLEPDIMLCYGQFAGRPIEFHVFDFGALSAALMTGKIDAIMACMTITEERQKTLNFSSPYHSTRTVCLYKKAAVGKDSKSFFERCKDSFESNLIAEKRWKLILQGLWETVVISFFAILFGTVIGGLLCWMRMSRRKILVGTSKFIVELMRGIPLLVFLMIMFYVVFASSGVTARWVAIIAFALNFGAYVSEMFRTSIEGVDKGQTEGGLAMGFTPVKTFTNFVLPQALAKVQPIYKGEAVSLVKNTSIVGYIAIQDLTKVSDIIRSRTFDAFFTLIVISIIYFLLAWLIGKLLDRLIKK